MPVPLPQPTAEEEPFWHLRVHRSLVLLNQLVSHKSLPLQHITYFSFCKVKLNMPFHSNEIWTPTCDAVQLFVGQFLVAELIVLRFVHECDAVGFQVGFGQKTLKLYKNDASNCNTENVILWIWIKLQFTCTACLKPVRRRGRKIPVMATWSPGWARRVFSPRAYTVMLLGMLPTGTWSLC